MDTNMSDGWAMHTRARHASSSLSLSQPQPHAHQPLHAQPPFSLDGDASSDADTEANSEKPSQPSQPAAAAAGEQAAAAAAAAAPSARLLRLVSSAAVVDYSSTAAFELPDCQLLIDDAPTQCNIEDPLTGSGRGGSKAHKNRRAAPTNSQPLSSAAATATPDQPRPLLSL